MQGRPSKAYLNPMESISIGYTFGNTENGFTPLRTDRLDFAAVETGHCSKNGPSELRSHREAAVSDEFPWSQPPACNLGATGCGERLADISSADCLLSFLLRPFIFNSTLWVGA